MNERELLRGIPKVDELLRSEELSTLSLPSSEVLRAVRAELDELRGGILRGERTDLPDRKTLCLCAAARAQREMLPSLRGVINATGVVLHTNLGRACLSERAAAAAASAARGYSTLEYNAGEGCRGSRGDHIEPLLCRLIGAEAAMVVNNNAAAVLLALSAIARGGEVIVSRGELVEIGGSFRIPEIVTQCGCALREVGTTNKTHLRDYTSAVGEQTRAILKVHTSNYRIVGFAGAVPAEELAQAAHERGLPLIEDLGSGTLFDLAALGIHGEPTVQQSIRAGVDLVSFSGDKLLGGPQAGVIAGRREYIERCRKHPLARALRVDKMTIAALQETLMAYLDPAAVWKVPTIAMLARSSDELHGDAVRLQSALAEAGVASSVVETEDAVGGGSAPGQLLDGWAVSVDAGARGAEALGQLLRQRERPIVGLIRKDRYLLAVRTIAPEDYGEIAAAVRGALA